jgi:hypothetical protein
VIWGIELTGLMLFAGFIAYARAREPFCVGCETWFGPERGFIRGGAATKTSAGEVTRQLAAGNPSAAALAFTGSEVMPPAVLELATRACPKCATDVYFRLRDVRVKNGKEHKGYHADWLLSTTDSKAFLDAIETRKMAPAPR